MALQGTMQLRLNLLLRIGSAKPGEASFNHE